MAFPRLEQVLSHLCKLLPVQAEGEVTSRSIIYADPKQEISCIQLFSGEYNLLFLIPLCQQQGQLALVILRNAYITVLITEDDQASTVASLKG